jgi:hypothetical protein
MSHTEDLSSRLVRLPFWIGLEEHYGFVADRVRAALHDKAA